MAWSGSSIFRHYVDQMVRNVIAYDYDADTVKAALYNTTTTPDNDVATDALSGYNGAASQWVVANEVSDGTNWDVGGEPLTTKAVNLTADTVTIDAADTPQSGASCTLAGVFGCLVYDDTLTNKPGFCYNYFGGSQSVTAGNFTIVWHANGVFRFTTTQA
jgi:hypothetical protein